MAYARTYWKDHSTQKPYAYKEVNNDDGSINHNPAHGEVLQQGTPQSATNFNKIEEGLQHTSIAFDMLYTMTQAQLRAADKRITALETKVQTLSS